MSNTIVNTNVSALNSHRAITAVGNRQARSSERLSSGMRINRASDDAAGLAISEKMRNQIRGLDQATRNSQDGISLVQTAEGALEEIHRILERTRELTNQASNDIYTDADRANILLEIDQLMSEVNQTVRNTEFNTMRLLSGNVPNNAAQQNIDAAQADYNAALTQRENALNIYSAARDIHTQAQTRYEQLNAALQAAQGTAAEPDAVAALDAARIDLQNAATFVEAARGGGNVSVVTAPGAPGDIVFDEAAGTISLISTDPAPTTNNPTPTAPNPITVSVNLTQGFDENDFNAAISDVITPAVASAPGNPGTPATGGGARGASAAMSDAARLLETATNDNTQSLSLQIQSGANSGQRTNVRIGNMSLAGLGLQSFTHEFREALVAEGGVADGGRQLSALQTSLDSAINNVSEQRANLGAVQNRLEHTINNLRVASENLSASNSRIRDTDMAREMMAFTQANVLQQAGMSMLAQANQAPQNVLQLLG